MNATQPKLVDGVDARGAALPDFLTRRDSDKLLADGAIHDAVKVSLREVEAQLSQAVPDAFDGQAVLDADGHNQRAGHDFVKRNRIADTLMRGDASRDLHGEQGLDGLLDETIDELFVCFHIFEVCFGFRCCCCLLSYCARIGCLCQLLFSH